MKRVALLTTFYEAESGYSLIAVAETQIRQLLAHGYDPVVIVQENFCQPSSTDTIWGPQMVDLRSVLPKFDDDGGNYLPQFAAFEGRVEASQTVLADVLCNIDVCLTHDIMLQEYYLEHNVAVRRYAKENPDLLWLHWIHSCPSGEMTAVPSTDWDTPQFCRHSPTPGYIVYPNDSDRNIVARTYRMPMERVIACRSGHAIDPLLVWSYHELTHTLVSKADLLNGEIVAIYPVRLDRGKQPEKIIRLMAGVKQAGYKPRLLIVDWQSNGKHFQQYIDELIELADKLDLSEQVNFTSRLDDRCGQGVPRQIVTELMDLSTVYIHPSRIETYSLVVHEAILRGKLIILNHDLPVMRELFGESAIYMDFGSDRVGNRTYIPSEQRFWNDEALRLTAAYRTNQVLVSQVKARRQWTPINEEIWRDFERLFYLQPVYDGTIC